jgi:hypothetical protein
MERGGWPLVGALPAAFERRVVVVEPGGRRPYDEAEWRDALVAIDSGAIRLEREGQPPRRFRQGDLLSFAGLGLSAIYNPGPEPAVLSAVSRKAPRR